MARITAWEGRMGGGSSGTRMFFAHLEADEVENQFLACLSLLLWPSNGPKCSKSLSISTPPPPITSILGASTTLWLISIVPDQFSVINLINDFGVLPGHMFVQFWNEFMYSPADRVDPTPVYLWFAPHNWSGWSQACPLETKSLVILFANWLALRSTNHICLPVRQFGFVECQFPPDRKGFSGWVLRTLIILIISQK